MTTDKPTLRKLLAREAYLSLGLHEIDIKTVRDALAVIFAEPYRYSDGHLTTVIRDDAAERFVMEYERLRGHADDS